MTALSLGQAPTLLLLHGLMNKDEHWSETEYGAEIQLRDGSPLPAWEKFPEVRSIILPLMRGVEAISLGYCSIIRIDPDKTLVIDDTAMWYEAILSASPDVVSEFGEDNRMVFPPGSLWMWPAPMKRHNGDRVPAISMIMALEPA